MQPNKVGLTPQSFQITYIQHNHLHAMLVQVPVHVLVCMCFCSIVVFIGLQRSATRKLNQAVAA